MLHVEYIYLHLPEQNHPNVGKYYIPYMENLGAKSCDIPHKPSEVSETGSPILIGAQLSSIPVPLATAWRTVH